MSSLCPDPIPQPVARQHCRGARERLSARFVAEASQAVCARLARAPLLWSGGRFALYRAFGNEVDLALLEAWLRASGRQCLLPVLRPRGLGTGLFFQRLRDGDPLCRNRFGIVEPCLDPRLCVPPRFLSVVFMPLLGFDSACNRLGMGGGFYDRALAFKRGMSAWRPLLIGTAFECQRVAALACNPWDVPLDAVVTETRVLLRDRRLAPWFS